MVLHSSHHSSKRRRLDQAASTLSKPFKSPLRTNAQNQTRENPNNNNNNGARKAVSGIAENEGNGNGNLQNNNNIIQSRRLHTNHQSCTEDSNNLASGNNNEAVQGHTFSPYTCQGMRSSSSTRLSSSFSSSSSPSLLASDPTLSALQKQQRNLQSRLSALRSELDIVQQASRIEASNKDQELQCLIEKWKAVSQEAAEELFAAAREKVLRMGGVEVWKERMKEKREIWYEEGEGSGRRDGNEDEDEGQDEGELEKRRAEVLNQLDYDPENIDAVDDRTKKKKRKRGRSGGREEELDADRTEDESDNDDDNSFTMDMMLKSLNVELAVIGFDKVNQRWIK